MGDLIKNEELTVKIEGFNLIILNSALFPVTFSRLVGLSKIGVRYFKAERGEFHVHNEFFKAFFLHYYVIL